MVLALLSSAWIRTTVFGRRATCYPNLWTTEPRGKTETADDGFRNSSHNMVGELNIQDNCFHDDHFHERQLVYLQLRARICNRELRLF